MSHSITFDDAVAIKNMLEDIAKLKDHNFFDPRGPDYGSYPFKYERPAIENCLKIFDSMRADSLDLYVATPLATLQQLKLGLFEISKYLQEMLQYKVEISRRKDLIIRDFHEAYRVFLINHSIYNSIVSNMRYDKLSDIVNGIRDAAVKNEAPNFGNHFNSISDSQQHASVIWLGFGILLTLVLFVELVLEGLWLSKIGLEKKDYFLLIPAFILAISFNMFCFRNYRINKHNSLINRHRELSINALQSFLTVAANNDPLKEVTYEKIVSTIFSFRSPGYIEDKSTDYLPLSMLLKTINSALKDKKG